MWDWSLFCFIPTLPRNKPGFKGNCAYFIYFIYILLFGLLRVWHSFFILRYLYSFSFFQFCVCCTFKHHQHIHSLRSDKLNVWHNTHLHPPKVVTCFWENSTKVVECSTHICIGRVHRKMKIHSLSTHHYADGGVGEVFECSKLFEFQG